jgi:hypothetical protein
MLSVSQTSNVLIFLVDNVVRAVLVENTNIRDIDTEFVQCLR